MRLIPARAGKTPLNAPCWAFDRAHPRAGGENSQSLPANARAAGSSPRGRGKLIRRNLTVGHGRLIPARAGKTSVPRRICPGPAAHPRAGGENAAGIASVALTQGSSPRGRGKLPQIITTIVTVRLIPARAGKTPEYSSE